MRLLILDELDLCVNAIEADSEDPKFLPSGHKYAPDHSGGDIGWRFLGGKWREPKVEVTPETLEELSARLRAKRDSLLSQTDWVVVKSYESSQPVPQEWVDYRQALRDITQQEGFPTNVTWPTKPE